MKRTSSTGLVIAAVAMVLMTLAYTAWWFVFAMGVRSGIEDWAAQQRAKGWQVAFDDMIMRGYPFALKLTLRKPQVAQPGRFDWQGPDVLATISPLTPGAVHLRAAGRHRLVVPAIGRQPILLDAATARATLDFALGGDPQALSVLLQSVTANQGAEQTTLEALQLRIERMEARASRTFEAVPNALAFTLIAQGATLPEQVRMPLGRTIASATVRGRLRGQWEPGSTRVVVETWRDSGGVIELDDIRLQWDPLGLAGNGTIALDDRLQPMVSLATRMTGFFDVVDRMTEIEVIRGRDASMAKLILGAMAKPATNGQPRTLDIPLTVQDNVVHAGPAAIAKLPDIDWPGTPLPRLQPVPLPPRVVEQPLIKPGLTIGPQGDVVR